MRLLMGLGIVFGLTAVAYFNRHSDIAPAIMMALVFPIALIGLIGSGRGRYDD